MVCVSITRDPKHVNRKLKRKLGKALHKAVVDVFAVKRKDVEIRHFVADRDNINTPPLAIEVDSGTGRRDWRLKDCEQILLDLNKAIEGVVPKRFKAKGKSNMWVRIFAKGKSMPIGCPDERH